MKAITDTEQVVQQQVCSYLAMRYPKVIFNSDGAGNNVSRAQAGINKMLRSSSGYPDLFIAEARTLHLQTGPVTFHGLFLELKRMGTRLRKKDGSWASEHLKQQNDMLAKLVLAGYCAMFALGFDEAKKIIDEYLGGLE